MTFEKIIKIISRTLAFIFVFAMADSFYLSQKGFAWINGELVLVKEANAQVMPVKNNVVPAQFVIEEKHVLGDKNAPVTIYEFSSFGCSHCADFHLNYLPKLQKEYIDKGQLKLVFVDFPIDKKSMKAAMLSQCMPEDKYFELLNVLFKKQMSWGLSFKTEKILASYAELLGVDNKKANQCMNNDDVAREIISLQQKAAEQLQIRGTPAFLIRAGKQSEMIYGLQEYEGFQQILNKYLNFN